MIYMKTKQKDQMKEKKLFKSHMANFIQIGIGMRMKKETKPIQICIQFYLNKKQNKPEKIDGW